MIMIFMIKNDLMLENIIKYHNNLKNLRSIFLANQKSHFLNQSFVW